MSADLVILAGMDRIKRIANLSMEEMKMTKIIKKTVSAAWKDKTRIPVLKRDLDIIAGMSCEHEIRGEKNCDKADLERGGCCNSCWASRWATSVLKKWKEPER